MGIRMIKLGDFCEIKKGKTGIKKAIAGEYPLVVTAENRRSHNEYQFDCKAVIVPLVSSSGHGHASIKRLHYQEGKFALGSILTALVIEDETILSPKFLYIYLSYFKDQLLVPLMKGAANVSLSIKKIAQVEIPLLDMDKQMEIIKLEKNGVRVKQLKEEYEHQLTLLSKLKQSILQEAIEGKLTKEWREVNPDVEPASVLLERIQAEKAQLVKDKKIKKQKPLPAIEADEKPFELPDRWVWVRPQEVCLNIVDCPHSTPKFILAGKECIDSTCVNMKGEILYNKIRKVSIETFNSRNKRLIPKDGDIVYVREGVIGQAVIIPKGMEACLGQRVMIFRPHREILSQFFRYVVTSKFYLDLIASKHKGIGAKHINMKDLRSIPIVLPPIKEQKIIVKKVEKMLEKINYLENEVQQSLEYADLLMQVVLQEAFEVKENELV